MPDGETEPALELRGVGKVFARTPALRATYLRVESGMCLALLGPNGSGKTTLLKIVAGATSATVGGGSIFGHDLLRDRFELRSVVGLLAADTYLYDDLTALENLRFVVTMSGKKSDCGMLLAVLRTVHLEQVANQRVRTFSSGMRRRLSLARLLVLRPRLVLLDEPYNSLDADGADLVDELVREWLAQGSAVILATHDAERALMLSGLVALLERGSLTYLGSVAGYRMRHAQHVG